MNDTLILLTLLSLKHFIIDFPLQTPFQWKNKGTYLHPGGLVHAGLHAFGTWLCIVWFAPLAAYYLALLDMFIHYHVDWAKMNINKKYGWQPDQHPEFWVLLGLDQLLHVLTYILIVSLITGV